MSDSIEFTLTLNNFPKIQYHGKYLVFQSLYCYYKFFLKINGVFLQKISIVFLIKNSQN